MLYNYITVHGAKNIKLVKMDCAEIVRDSDQECKIVRGATDRLCRFETVC